MNNNEVKLEKKLSPINVWSLALGYIIGWGALGERVLYMPNRVGIAWTGFL